MDVNIVFYSEGLLHIFFSCDPGGKLPGPPTPPIQCRLTIADFPVKKIARTVGNGPGCGPAAIGSPQRTRDREPVHPPPQVLKPVLLARSAA